MTTEASTDTSTDQELLAALVEHTRAIRSTLNFIAFIVMISAVAAILYIFAVALNVTDEVSGR